MAPLLLPGCLGPATGDRVGYSSHLSTEGTVIPTVESDKRLLMQVDTNDGLDGPLVALRSAYTGGTQVQYWDLGAASSTSFPPMWIFRRADADKNLQDFGHPSLIDSLPGDPGYSPIRALYIVLVTSTYAGQRITSTQALDDAIELGLVKKPKTTGTFANCPVTLSSVALEMGEGEDPLSPTVVYYRGKKASYFALDDARIGLPSFAPDKNGKVPAPNAYLLRRQNETKVLDEMLWHADLDADGDMVDTNLIFQVGDQDPKYNSVWRQINVTVPVDYVFATSQSESNLFDRSPSGIAAIDGAVIDYQDTGMLLNRPIHGGAP